VKVILSFFGLLLIAALPGIADFKAGVEAYDRGDYATALREWQPSADRGDPNAEYNLGLMSALGQGVTQNYQQAADWYRKAADQGVAAAQFNLGVLYANGQGVAADPAQAIQWFLKAAEQGIGDAEVNLGQLYSQPKSASQNYSEAVKWYRKAAERGVASAAFDLAVLYDVGQGVPQDYATAIQWYTKAAEAGYAPALTNLGILYYNAQGVKRDLQQACAWFARAQKMGEPRAGELFRTTAERMKPKEIKNAQLLAEQWTPPSSPPKPSLEEDVLFKQPQTAIATSSASPVNQPSATGSADRVTGEPDRTTDGAPAAPAPPQQ
jgi:TPR repeat protein